MGDTNRKLGLSKDVCDRLSRCEGHLRSIRRMAAQGRTCESLFVQLAAVRSAVNEISVKIYQHHLDSCLGLAPRRLSPSKAKQLQQITRLILRGRS